MLCSTCSNPIKPVVALDIDGTMGGYHNHFRKFAEQYTARDLPSDYNGVGKFHVHLGLEHEEYRQIKLAYRQGGMKRSLPADQQLPDLMATLQRLDVEVWITTTRPFQRLDNIDPDTRFWLNRHGVTYDGILFDVDKYTKLAEAVDPTRVVAVLDDLPEMCRVAWMQFGPRAVIQKTSRYNRGVPVEVIDRTESLRYAARLIEERVNEWRDHHGAH